MGGMYSVPCDLCGTRHAGVDGEMDHAYTLAGVAPPPVLAEPPPPPPRPDTDRTRRHPKRIVYPAPSGWRAECSCGWTEGHYPDRHAALGGVLEHAEHVHAYITPDPQETTT